MLTVECYGLTENVEGVGELENQHFASIIIKDWIRQEVSMNAGYTGKL